MPIYKCADNKWKIGKGPCIYDSKKQATKAWIAILIKKEKEKDKK